MSKKRGFQSYGNTADEVNASIAQMEAERQQLSKKAGTKEFSGQDNKRFEELSSNIASANKQLQGLQPAQNQQPVQQPFTEQRTEVIQQPQQVGQGTASVGAAGQANQATGTPSISAEQPVAGDIRPLASTPIAQIPTNQNILNIGGPGQIEVPQTSQNKLVNDVLGSINRPQQTGTDINQEINKSVFGPPNQRNFGAPGVATTLTAADVSRGINEPINVGQVSGQIIGSQPIFVGGGGYLPFHVIARRQQELQAAAAKTAEEVNALLLRKPPLVKDKGFQGSINEQFKRTQKQYISEAQRLYGSDWGKKLLDQTNPLSREFVTALDNYDFIAGMTDQVTDQMAEIDKDLKSGDRVFSDQTLQLRDDYNRLQNDFLNGDVSNIGSMREMFDKLKGFTNLDKILTDQDFDIDGQVKQIASLYDKGDIYGVNSVKRKEFEDQVRVIANGLAKGQMRDAVNKGYITEDEIFNRILARHGSEYIQTKTASKSPSGSGIKIEFDPNNFVQSPQTQNIGGFQSEADMSYKIPTNVKSFDASGLNTYDQNGNPIELKGIKNVKPNEVQLVKFTNPKTGKITYKKAIVANVEEEVPLKDPNTGAPTGKTTTTTRDVLIDLEEPETQKRLGIEVFKGDKGYDMLDAQLERRKTELGEKTIPVTDKKSRVIQP